MSELFRNATVNSIDICFPGKRSGGTAPLRKTAQTQGTDRQEDAGDPVRDAVGVARHKVVAGGTDCLRG